MLRRAAHMDILRGEVAVQDLQDGRHLFLDLCAEIWQPSHGDAGSVA